MEKNIVDNTIRETKSFSMDSLKNLRSNHDTALNEAIIAMDDVIETCELLKEGGAMLSHVKNEVPNIVQCVSYKFNMTDREALFWLLGLYAGDQLSISL
jgi:hypothetical protein